MKHPFNLVILINLFLEHLILFVQLNPYNVVLLLQLLQSLQNQRNGFRTRTFNSTNWSVLEDIGNVFSGEGGITSTSFSCFIVRIYEISVPRGGSCLIGLLYKKRSIRGSKYSISLSRNLL